jgi:glutathione S-transferase
LVRTYLLSYIFPKTGDGSPNRKAIDAVVPAVQQEIDLLDRAVAKGGFLAGDSFTFADINLMPILAYMKNFPESGSHSGGEGAFGLFRSPGRAAELSEDGAAAAGAG